MLPVVRDRQIVGAVESLALETFGQRADLALRVGDRDSAACPLARPLRRPRGCPADRISSRSTFRSARETPSVLPVLGSKRRMRLPMSENRIAPSAAGAGPSVNSPSFHSSSTLAPAGTILSCAVGLKFAGRPPQRAAVQRDRAASPAVHNVVARS